MMRGVSKLEKQRDLDYLKLLSMSFPTAQSAATEIINLKAILNLPKGTEHFMSDIHGEYEAFSHILSSASGSIKEKIDFLFSDMLTDEERAELATVVYYPKEKMDEIEARGNDMTSWYKDTLNHLIELCHLVSSKYTRSKVRKALPAEYAYVIDELLNTDFTLHNKKEYYDNIIDSIISLGKAPDFIEALCDVIKHLIVDRLHIVGDIFDRGPRADIVLDKLMEHHSVDIQWGNHDVLWMGAAAGSEICVATVLANSILYNNLGVIESGYGISLRPLAVFAKEVYDEHDYRCFEPRVANPADYKEKDLALSARMCKAVTVILFKLEGQVIMRNPDFGMSDRLLFKDIDYNTKTVMIGGKSYALKDTDFPTVNKNDPYALTPDESALIDELTESFEESEKLQNHIRFLYSKGGIYRTYNGNLLEHGCIPMNKDGSFMEFEFGGCKYSGKALLDYCSKIAHDGYFAKENTPARRYGQDFLWFLWCGKNSPVFARERITTFERRLIAEKETHTEPKNAYYELTNSPEICDNILAEFGLSGPNSHIINGHTPIHSKDGESPVKAGGKLIIIDGGFCRAYQPQTGIAGYTLIYNSYIMRLISHEPFPGRESAIKDNKDILSASVVFERLSQRIKISETDNGKVLQKQIDDLSQLLDAYNNGLIHENHTKV
jgi:fructose-1,6-bisphosphatase-3